MTSLEEFESQIANDFGEHRGEYRVLQTGPCYRDYQAQLVLLPASRAAAEHSWQELSDRVKGFVGLREDLATAPQTSYLRICHDSDRCYGGYANIYRAIRSLSCFLADCHFFVAEADSCWVDEYRIHKGAFSFVRCQAPSPTGDDYRMEGREWLMARVLEIAQAEAGDVRDAMSEHFAQIAASSLDLIDTPDDTKQAGQAQDAIAKALTLQAATASVSLQQGRLARLQGESAEALAAFQRAQASKDATLTSAAVVFIAALALEVDHSRNEDVNLKFPDELQPSDFASCLLLACRERDKAKAMAYVGTLVDKRGEWKPPTSALLTGPVSLKHYERLGRLILSSNRPKEQKAELIHGIARSFVSRVSHGPSVYFKLVDSFFAYLLKAAPCDATYWYQWAELQRRHNRTKRGGVLALEYYAKAAETGEHREALQQLAEHYYGKKKYHRAQPLYRRYLVSSASAKTKGYGFNLYLWHALFNGAACMLCHISEREGKAFLSALEDVNSAVKAFVPWFESQEHALVLLADLLAFEQRYEEAKTVYQLSVELDGESVQAISHEASAWCNESKYGKATALLDKAEKLDCGYWHLYYMRACLAARQEQGTSAVLAHLTKACDLVPDHCRTIIREEKDFASIRSDPRFRALIGAQGSR